MKLYFYICIIVFFIFILYYYNIFINNININNNNIIVNNNLNWKLVSKDNYPLPWKNITFTNKYYKCIHTHEPKGFCRNEYVGHDTYILDIPLNLDKLVNVLTNKTIAYVGDSLTRQQAIDMKCLLHAYGIDKKYNITIDYQPNQYLFESKIKRPHPIIKYNSVPKWYKKLLKGDYYAIVLNIGHWVEPSSWTTNAPGETWPEGFYNILHRTIDNLEKVSNKNMYWRTVSTRHFENGNWNTIPKGVCNRTKPTLIPYNKLSGGFAVVMQNALIRELIQKSPINILDVESISKTRCDNHKDNDCAHFCLPGVPHAWNNIFLHKLINDNL
jgi:hypothetical protein